LSTGSKLTCDRDPQTHAPMYGHTHTHTHTRSSFLLVRFNYPVCNCEYPNVVSLNCISFQRGLPTQNHLPCGTRPKHAP